MEVRHGRLWCIADFQFISALPQGISQPQHGEERIVTHELHIRHCLAGITALAPSHELGVAPHHGRFVSPHVLRANQHRAVRVRDIHDPVIAGVLLEKALFVRIHDGSAVKRGTRAARKNKHFRRAQSDHAKERTRLSPGEGQDDAKERANSSGNKQRHRCEML